MENHIVPECYIDTMLICSILQIGKNKRLNHKHGCFNVGRELEKGSLKNVFGVGLIDNDKRKVGYLEDFFEIEKVSFIDDVGGNAIVLLKHKVKHHYFIQICPAIENWIIQICKESNIVFADFRLPDSLDEIKKITKAQSSMFDERFIKLFKAMRQSGHIAIKTLEKWLKLLFEKNYKVDINELKNV